MTAVQKIQILPRVVVTSSLRLARLPLDVASKVTGHAADESWPPAIAFESAVAGVGAGIAALVGDDAWRKSSQLRQAKVSQLRKAARLESLAAQQQTAAVDRYDEESSAARLRREQAEKQAEQRRLALEAETAKAKQSAGQKAEQKRAAARKARAKQDAAIATGERRTKAQSLAKESAAISKAQDAVAAQKTVEIIDNKLSDTQARRKSS